MYNPFRNIFTSLVEFWHSCSHKSYFNKEEGRLIATKYGLIEEYEQALSYGLNPDEALQEWDIYPYGEENIYKNKS